MDAKSGMKAEKRHEIQHRGRAGGVAKPCWQRNKNKLAQLLGRPRRRGGPSDSLPRQSQLHGDNGSRRTYFWLCERIKLGEVTLEHRPTNLMFANVLTKPLQEKQFVTLEKNSTPRVLRVGY
jgi:hypothetical protein